MHLRGCKELRGLKGQDAVVAASAEGVQVLPAKTCFFTAKPGSGDKWFRRKCRVVGCGNFERPDPELELFASGVPADVLRACLIEAAHRGFFCVDFGYQKRVFFWAPLPDESRGKILLRPPKILEQLNITVSGELWEVCKAVYGLRQSPRWWSSYRDSVLSQACWIGPYGRTRLIQSTV